MSTVISFLHGKDLRCFAGLPGLEDESLRRISQSGVGQPSPAPPTRSMRADIRSGTGRRDQAGDQGQWVPWRGLSQSAGALETREDSLIESAAFAAHARDRVCSPSHAEGRSVVLGLMMELRVDEMWGTDMTTILLGTWQQVCVFVAVARCSASCAGEARGYARHAF